MGFVFKEGLHVSLFSWLWLAGDAAVQKGVLMKLTLFLLKTRFSAFPAHFGDK